MKTLECACKALQSPAGRSREAAATANMLRNAVVTRIRARIGETNVPPMRQAVIKQAKTWAALAKGNLVQARGRHRYLPVGQLGKGAPKRLHRVMGGKERAYQWHERWEERGKECFVTFSEGVQIKTKEYMQKVSHFHKWQKAVAYMLLSNKL